MAVWCAAVRRGRGQSRCAKRRPHLTGRAAAGKGHADVPPQAWGRRAEGRRRGQRQAPRRAPRPRLGTLEGPMRQDLGDAIDLGVDRALRQGRSAEEGVHEVLVEAAVLASKGVRTTVDRHDKNVQREINRVVAPEDRPQFFPHFRKTHDWDEQESAGEGSHSDAPRSAPEHFFSKKPWDAVYGMTDDVVDVAASLKLPRPSRIQNLTYHDIVEGRSTVIADQAGSGKTLAYLLPLLKRHVFGAAEAAAPSQRLKLLVLAPTADLAGQIMSVARTVSALGAHKFRVHCCTASGRLYTQRQQIAAGTDVLISTAGRLRGMLLDPEHPLDLGGCRAVVMDEVDVLVQDGADVGVEELRLSLPPSAQWVFVTATLAEVARQQLGAFEALALRGADGRGRGLAWHVGPGLHRVSPRCEHVVVDCTPRGLYDLPPSRRLGAVMREKALALAWHLRHGVLRDMEDSRVVVFCNTIANCQMVENMLRKMDPRDRRTGARRWKVFVLHGQRDKEDYRELAEAFSSSRTHAKDFFKKKILVCTDRLSRGMDFSRQPVNWVVLLDWPRDATEYLRRVGRTARGGGHGGVLSFPVGLRELRMAKQVTSAAVRGIPLQGRPEQMEERAFCLERFDPCHPDWRSREAAAPRPRAAPEEEGEEGEEGEAPWGPEGREEAFEDGAPEAPRAARPWRRAESWERAQGWTPWADDGAAGAAGGGYDDDDDDYELGEDLLPDDVGVSLYE